MSDMSMAGKPWSDEEHKNLLQEVSDGKTIEEISILHKRTEGSITARLYDYAGKLMRDENISSREAHNRVNKLIDITRIKIAPEKRDKKSTSNEIQQPTLEKYLLEYAELQEEIVLKKLVAAKIQTKIRKIMYEKNIVDSKMINSCSYFFSQNIRLTLSILSQCKHV